MAMPCLARRNANTGTRHGEATPTQRWLLLCCIVLLASVASAMSPARIAELRQETVSMFYHGFDNYMDIAFPEDELRPVTCAPLTRDRENPANIQVNDVLGNYSLTLIDSLSTLAILASAPPDDAGTGPKALRDFQKGVKDLVEQYGDGRPGRSGQGLRARGFDLDSKVQVFETVIRGVGGLLSAHLFATGDLPINGYRPRRTSAKVWSLFSGEERLAIKWPNDFTYDGQLLRLAKDLAERLLPAFYGDEGLPYPRVNLRHGVPFYPCHPLIKDPRTGQCTRGDNPEITETCSAGAGSLVLEFSTLSRLTGDHRFEQAAKRAFWAVWKKRSDLELLGNGIDAESGIWAKEYISGIGAGIDSFFEYAFKTHILLSGHEIPNISDSTFKNNGMLLDPEIWYGQSRTPLTVEQQSSDSFLEAWEVSHAAIKKHLYTTDLQHPYYINAEPRFGTPRAFWIDSLGAYYPGLLTLAGELEEAIQTNLLYTALWTRYSALPERWSVRNSHVEGGLGWWPGRPEFIESNYHLYRATKDPWYLHVGEMVLRDIKRRCWTECGWAGLQDVITGEKSDRMESFFLGETAKYLYLLFDPDHPLNSLDAPYVFTTEGHPLIIPRKNNAKVTRKVRSRSRDLQPLSARTDSATCPVPPPLVPFTISATAARPDVFHAASLTELHRVPNTRLLDEDLALSKPESKPESKAESSSSTSPPHTISIQMHDYYPWTLPRSLIPTNATCAPLPFRTTTLLEFPSLVPTSTPPTPPILNALPGASSQLSAMQFIRVGTSQILVQSTSGLRLALELTTPPTSFDESEESEDPFAPAPTWRIYEVGNSIRLGRDEKILMSRDMIGNMQDPNFSIMRDPAYFDIIVQTRNEPLFNASDFEMPERTDIPETTELPTEGGAQTTAVGVQGQPTHTNSFWSSLKSLTSFLRTATPPAPAPTPISAGHTFTTIEAIGPIGAGAAPLPDFTDVPFLLPGFTSFPETLEWKGVFFAGQACDGKLPDESVREYEVIVIRRGGCTFDKKVGNVPAFVPGEGRLKLVVVVSDEQGEKFEDEYWEDVDEDENDGDDADDFVDGDEGYGKAHSGRRDGEKWVMSGITTPMLDEPQKTPGGMPRRYLVPMAMVEGGRAVEDMLRRAVSVGARRRYWIETQGIKIENLKVI